jgi:DnaK suppressor protein
LQSKINLEIAYAFDQYQIGTCISSAKYPIVKTEWLMETYDSSQAQHFSLILDKREKELRALLHASQYPLNSVGEDAPHEVMDFKDMATEQVQDTIDEAKTEQASYELEQVLAARQRLHRGGFGDCLNCGNPIDLRRLMALPAAALCTSCQSIQEHEQPLAKRRSTLHLRKK